MDGGIDPLIEALSAHRQAELLETTQDKPPEEPS
jgi:hypothetical protein